MSVFVDTSAFYAHLVRNDTAHAATSRAFAALVAEERPLWTTSFVIVETMALLQHRIGLAAARDFEDRILPAVHVRWVDEPLYRLGTDRLWRDDKRRVSLVDCVSFEFMRTQGLSDALAVDPHFAAAGFKVIP